MDLSIEYRSNSHLPDNNLETFSLLWLDAAVDTSEENREAQKQLRSTINYVTTFDNENHCKEYMQSLSIYDRVVLIVSGRLGKTIVPRIHDMRQLSSIYVYCLHKERNEEWAQNFVKVKAVVVKLDDLIHRIKEDQTKRTQEEDPMVIDIFAANQNPDLSTSGLNGNFIHNLLLIDVLLRMKPAKTDKQEFIQLCKKHYEGNKNQLAVVNDFEMNYSLENAFWWYSKDSFLYKILNKALRVQNIDILFMLRFFMRDLSQALTCHRSKSFQYVYRGQVLSKNELVNLRNFVGDLISVNSFFSTTTNYEEALKFLQNSIISNDLRPVLFIIEADPNVGQTKPFADIRQYSKYKSESEILFMVGSIFRLKKMYQNKDRVWVIELTLCSDDDHDTRNLFQYMKKYYGGGDNEANLLNFGQILRRMGKFDVAETFYRRLLNELSSNDPLLISLYYSLGLVLKEKKEYDSSLEYFYKSLKLLKQSSPQDYRKISMRYNVIGSIYQRKNEYDSAISWFNKGIEILQKNNVNDYVTMAHFYNNMALVYERQNKYKEALKFNKITLEIREEHLPSNHSDIAVSYSNIGSNHRRLGNSKLALENYKESLNLRLKSLPSDHPHLADSYRNIGLVLEDTGQLNEALKNFQQSALIYRQLLTSQHPDIIEIEEDIRRISSKS